MFGILPLTCLPYIKWNSLSMMWHSFFVYIFYTAEFLNLMRPVHYLVLSYLHHNPISDNFNKLSGQLFLPLCMTMRWRPLYGLDHLNLGLIGHLRLGKLGG